MELVSPVRCDLLGNLEKDQILEILCDVSDNRDLLSNAPPVLPKEGELYVFDLGHDASLWERNKKKLR